MNIFVHLLGAWFATQAASGRYPRPVALGIGMLVSRLGAPATLFALAGYALTRLKEDGAFDGLAITGKRARPRQKR